MTAGLVIRRGVTKWWVGRLAEMEVVKTGFPCLEGQPLVVAIFPTTRINYQDYVLHLTACTLFLYAHSHFNEFQMRHKNTCIAPNYLKGRSSLL